MPKKQSNGGAVAAPATGAPRPPKGFKAPSGRSGVHPTVQQERDALDVAREVSTSKKYAADFTKRAPPAADLAAELTVAKAWSDELDAAEAWLAYVRAQRDVAWGQALATAKKLKLELDVAVAHDPSVATRYPQTKAFLDVWKVAAVRGAATRASKKKASPKPADK